MFCVFEGIDGSGKTTLTRGVHTALVTSGKNSGAQAAGGDQSVLLLREPTDLPTGQRIRSLLSTRTQLEPEEWLALFMQDRKENLATKVEPALARGAMVLQDRYYYSTAAYQGKRRERGEDEVRGSQAVQATETSGGSDRDLTATEIVRRHTREGFREPDLLFYIDLAPESALQRIQASRHSVETFETLDQLRLIYENYREILPGSTITLNGSLSPDRLVQECVSHIRAHASL